MKSHENPIWNLPNTGGGLLIAIIAIIHVAISHLAVGGGLFLVLTERIAIKTDDNGLLAYVKSHTKFFLLLTMVLGDITGVGIWFIIALVHPAATSVLIHNFVFAWAIEWVFFLAEIVALLIYHYRFNKMNPRDHMIIGWLYFIFAWLSLFVINGILGFMLTPGPSGITSMRVLLIFSGLLFILGLWTLVKWKPVIQKVLSMLMILIIIGWMSGFEYSREIARKPFVLYNIMYSTGVTAEQLEGVNKQGVLKFARWSSVKEITDENIIDAGREVFRLQCAACHTLKGYNQISNKTGDYQQGRKNLIRSGGWL